MIRWPGNTPPNTVSQQQWAFYDFMATALDLAQYTGSIPANDGYSLVPTLRGKVQPQPSFIYHEYCGERKETKKGDG